jgi:ubiquinone/menaquinone biosynthesis C-methylase UbiE
VADLQLDSEKFDAVFAFGLFHHVPQWPRALAEVYRVLKPGGVLAGGEINQEKPLNFYWSDFAQDVKKAGFDLLASQKIYWGFFHSFVAIKPEVDQIG